MQTILGSGGAIGTELAKALVSYDTHIRLVSRNPQKVNSSDELMKADLLIYDEVEKAVEGSEVVYLTAGLPYTAKYWKENWPKIMHNVIQACEKYDARLVFFDNVYMYDADHLGYMTEQTPVNPISEKGKVRATLNKMIMDEVKQNKLTALIARCADYYGPNIQKTSMLTEAVINPLAKGKKANWMGSIKYKHSFTFTPDAGKGTALLGNTPDAYNQVWHLPTAQNPLNGKQWIEALSNELGVKPRMQVAPKGLVRIIGLFMPFMKEMVEMMYQYDREYIFDSTKFEQRFHFKPTPYAEGIKQTIAEHPKTE